MLWNSRSQEVIGLAMVPEDMSSLQDIYTSLTSEQEPQQATYMLQFLWRDLTSKFDVMGPYYSSAESLKSKFILACLYETMKLFQLYGFQTSAVVCDGASTNLTALKTATGCLGAYGAVASTSDQRYPIPPPKFENPFNPPHLVYWIICPSHQVYVLLVSVHTALHLYVVEEYGQCPLFVKTWWYEGLCVSRCPLRMGRNSGIGGFKYTSKVKITL